MTMAALQVNSIILRCDGCDTALDDGAIFQTAVEARASAYAAGWRFPHRLGKTGNPIARASDVCPACVPGWKPVRSKVRPAYQYTDGSVRAPRAAS
jgi:hypothetical protein